MTTPLWVMYLCVVLGALLSAGVGAFVGTLGGIDWSERRRTRDLRRKRANIQRALDHDDK